ncbi:MAG: 23S rRNA (uracil(1939)-C(5))-methyltransferase RlmD, partial [Gammaproteobacteria bacterium]
MNAWVESPGYTLAALRPRCAHYAECGGCVVQHLAREVQLSVKQEHLLRDLETIGRVRPDVVLPPVYGPAWGYRRRARLSARGAEPGHRVRIGFSRKDGRGVTSTECCEILDPRIGAHIGDLARLLSTLSVAAHIPQVEVAAGESAVVLLLRVLAEPSSEDCKRLLAFERAHALRFYLQRGRASESVPLAGGPACLDYRLPDWDLRLEFSPGDFIQVNATMNRALIRQAIALLALEPGQSVL